MVKLVAATQKHVIPFCGNAEARHLSLLRQRRSPSSLTHPYTHRMVKLFARTESDVNMPVCAFVSPLEVCHHVVCLCLSVSVCVCLCLSVSVYVCLCLFVSAQSSQRVTECPALSSAPVFACPGPPLVCARVCRFRSERGCGEK
jgi:hypothetical protein